MVVKKVTAAAIGGVFAVSSVGSILLFQPQAPVVDAVQVADDRPEAIRRPDDDQAPLLAVGDDDDDVGGDDPTGESGPALSDDGAPTGNAAQRQEVAGDDDRTNGNDGTSGGNNTGDDDRTNGNDGTSGGNNTGQGTRGGNTTN